MRLGLLVLFAASAFGQAKPDAAEILAKVKETWKDLKSYDVDFVLTLGDPKTGQEQVGEVRVAAAIEPDRYRLVYSGGEGSPGSPTDGTMIYDGSNLWAYLPSRNEYRTASVTPDNIGRDLKPTKVNIDEGIGQYTRMVERFDVSHFLRQESVSIGGGAAADCFVIETVAGGQMWIDKSNYHVVRAEEVHSDGTYSNAVIRIKLNEPLADDLFKFVPPPGARNLGKP